MMKSRTLYFVLSVLISLSGCSKASHDLLPEPPEDVEVAVMLTFPPPRLPDYLPTRAASAVALRGVAEVRHNGTSELLLTKRGMLAATDREDVYRFDLSLAEGEYKINLWVDYATDAATDNHYTTTDLNLVKTLHPESYVANTDTRDAFSQHITLTVVAGRAAEAVTMHRPLAKYRLVTTDIAEYNELRRKEGWPAMEDLKIEIAYDGFWPNAYSVPNAAPAGAEGGYHYTSAWSEQNSEEATAGKDYVFVNGTESFVKLSLTFRNNADQVVGMIRNIEVNYRIGYLTTVRGNFLTAATGSGVQIDTEWSGEYEVEF